MTDQPQLGVAVVARLGGVDRQHHRQRAHQQHERAHRGERDVVDLRRPRRAGVPAAVQHVGGDQAAEQQALAAEEQPHRHLVVGQPGGGVEVLVPGPRSARWPSCWRRR